MKYADRNEALFQHFPVSQRLPLKSYRPNDRLFDQFDDAKSLFLVREGMVRHSVESPDGKRFNLGFVTSAKPVLLGTDAFITLYESRMSQYQSFAQAMSPVKAQKIDLEYIKEKLDTDPTNNFSIELMLYMTLIIKSRHKRLLDLSYSTVFDRVMTGLPEIAHMISPQVNGEHPAVITGLTQSDISEYIGIHRPVLNKILHDLSDRGFITLSKGEITLTDPEIMYLYPSARRQICNGKA
jgi:CRP-like cAMP-binding protein